MKRITVFADHDLKHPLAGGANVNLQENLRRLTAQFKITLLTTWAPGLAEQEIMDDIQIYRFKGNLYSLRYRIAKFYKKNLEKQTDIVWDEVDFSVPWLTPLYIKKPILMHCHHFQKKNFYYELNPFLATAAYFIEPCLYWLYRKNKVIAVSESTKQSLIAIGIPETNIHVIPPALDTSIFSSWESILPLKTKTPTLITLARLRAWKGIHFAIQAMKQVHQNFPNVKLLIIGKGPYEAELRSLVKKLSLNSVVDFLGWMNQSEKLEHLKRANLLIKTSVREGWGIDVLEANACGTPAIGWNVDGTKDSIQHLQTGTLVPFGNIQALSQSICQFISNSSEQIQMGHRAWQYAQKFTWDSSAEKITKILNQMV